MGVADKTRVPVGGMPLLDRTLRALVGAGRIVVVGEPRATVADVTWTSEKPTGGGPAAGLAAGLAHATADYVVVLAGDLALVTREDVGRLVDAVTVDGAVYVDDGGQEQWLCSAWRTGSLRGVPLIADASLRGVLRGLDFAKLAAPGSVLDCDTPEDLLKAEELLGERAR